jgi:ABC-type nickel/cobalt efflux system permease component RcnA
MQTLLPLLFAGVVGFTHAFEIDHLLAVSSIATRRKSVLLAIKDGIYWGLGHTSTILVIGICMILAKVAVSEQAFHYCEAGVGVMLVLLGIHRIWKTGEQERQHEQAHRHEVQHGHKLAYGIGLVHGLAGSGALVLLVMTQLKNPWEGIIYLVIFGAGSIAGMLLASGIFGLPFSSKVAASPLLHRGLTLLSSLLCIGFGCKVVFENLIGS